MYCPNCGNEVKDNEYCPSCGRFLASRNNNSSDVKPEVQKKAKNYRWILISLPIIIIFVLILSSFLLITSNSFIKNLKNLETKEYIEFDKFNIPTLYKVTGKKEKVCSGNIEKSDSYQRFDMELCHPVTEADTKRYVDHLISIEGFILNPGEHQYDLYTEKEGFVIKITINANSVFKYSVQSSISFDENNS